MLVVAVVVSKIPPTHSTAIPLSAKKKKKKNQTGFERYIFAYLEKGLIYFLHTAFMIVLETIP